jgi:hypothetical protein
VARIALDIDSTLHPCWDLFRSIVHERFGESRAGIVGATILDPWNREFEGAQGVVAAVDWSQLRDRLRPHLARLQESTQ